VNVIGLPDGRLLGAYVKNTSCGGQFVAWIVISRSAGADVADPSDAVNSAK
jgi:hypothetical protein